MRDLSVKDKIFKPYRKNYMQKLSKFHFITEIIRYYIYIDMK